MLFKFPQWNGRCGWMRSRPMMVWTQLPPDEPGYYWFFEEHRGETDVEIVECRRIVIAAFDPNLDGIAEKAEIRYFIVGFRDAFTAENLGAGSYWMGPIPVPSKEGSCLGFSE